MMTWKRLLLLIVVLVLLIMYSIANYSETYYEIVRKFSIRNMSHLASTTPSPNAPWWDGGSCSSEIFFNKSDYRPISGFCGNRAHYIGPHQKVISFTLYGNVSMFGAGLEDILKTTQKLYPGWLVRLYTRPELNQKKFCPLLQQYPHFHICDVDCLNGINSETFGKTVQPQLWRVGPLLDSLVDVFLVRDIDAEILPREVAAVRDFMESDHILHLMRDHRDHTVPVMAGMFGVKNRDIKKSAEIGKALFQERNFGLNDQVALQGSQYGDLIQAIGNLGEFVHVKPKYLYSVFKDRSLQHDSYNCQMFVGSIPFPTQRDGYKHIGNKKYLSKVGTPDTKLSECPVACRPRNHTDWKYC